MKKIIYTLLAILLTSSIIEAQTKIKDGTISGSSSLPNADAIIEAESNNKGFLLPRVELSATSDASPLTQHVAGMTVYNTVSGGSGLTAVVPGYYYNDGTQWVKLSTLSSSVEPWNETTTTDQATLNTQNIYQTGKVGIGPGFSTAEPTHQLDVNGDFKALNSYGDSIVGFLSNASSLGGTKDMAGNISMNGSSMSFVTAGALQTVMGYNQFSTTQDNNLTIAPNDVHLEAYNRTSQIGGFLSIYPENGNVALRSQNPSSNFETRILIDHNVNGGISLATGTSGTFTINTHYDFSNLQVEKGKGIRFSHNDNAGVGTADYFFPVTGGTAGQVLTTEGGMGGQLYWSNATGGSWNIETTTNPATSNTQNIYQKGKVAVGEGSGVDPIIDQFVINKPSDSSGDDAGMTIDDAGSQRISHIRFDGLANGSQGHIDWRKSGSNAIAAAIRSVGTNTNSTKGLAFYTNNDTAGSTDALERMRITEDGKVGIGTDTPNEALEVNGAFKVGDGGYTGIASGDPGPIPTGGAGTIIFTNGNFFGWNGTIWKQLDN